MMDDSNIGNEVPKETLSRYLGLSFFSLIILGFLLAQFCWVVSIPVIWALPVAALASQAFLLFRGGFNHRKIGFLILFICLLVCSVFVSGLVFDFSFDGNTYHPNTIFAIKNGWNPFRGTNEGVLIGSFWSKYYALGMETVEAMIYSLTGNIQTGKAANLWLLFAALFVLDYSLRAGGFGKKRFLLVALVACNPVVVSQMLSFYVDHTQYLLMVTAISFLFLWQNRKERLDYFCLILALAFAISVKVNVGFWVMLFTVLSWLVFGFRKDQVLQIAVAGVSAVLIGFLVMGYFPYVTNFISKGNPFYPLMGEGSVDIISINAPSQISGMSPLLSPFYSIVYPLTSDCSFMEYFASSKLDARLGGFGPVFAVSLILGFFLPLFLERGLRIRLWLVMIFTLLMTLVLPAGWWARYVPFVYGVPVVAVLFWQKSAVRGRMLMLACSALLALNVLFFVPQMLVKYIQYNTFVKEFVSSSLSPVKLDGYNVGMVVNLADAGVKCEIVPEEQCNYEIVTGPPVKMQCETLPALPAEKQIIGITVKMPEVRKIK